jgi:predicted nuclease with TOPRIM domain
MSDIPVDRAGRLMYDSKGRKLSIAERELAALKHDHDRLQDRCTELVNENEALREKAATHRAMYESKKDYCDKVVVSFTKLEIERDRLLERVAIWEAFGEHDCLEVKDAAYHWVVIERDKLRVENTALRDALRYEFGITDKDIAALLQETESE